MLTKESKKASIVMILKVLEEYSDENHYLTQKEIIDKVFQLYGVELERKSVAYSLTLLQDLEYDINKSSKGGYALLSRTLENSEIKYILDALFSSKSITGKQAIEISNKLNKGLSKYQRKDYNYILKSTGLNRAKNKDVFYLLELIEEAKKNKKRISFQYQSFDENGNLCKKMDGYRYIVSPYFTVNSNGRYFLLCNYREKYRPIQIFRIDYMINPKIEEEWPLKAIESLKGYANFDIVKYLNDNIYLLDGEVIESTLLIKDASAVGHIIDWFGLNAKIYNKDNKLYADVKCNENALFYWYMQYSENIVILSPTKLIDRIKLETKRILDKYTNI